MNEVLGSCLLFLSGFCGEEAFLSPGCQLSRIVPARCSAALQLFLRYGLPEANPNVAL